MDIALSVPLALTSENFMAAEIAELKTEKKLATLKNEELELESDIENVNYEALANVRSEIAKLNDEKATLEPLAGDNAVTDDDIAAVIELWTGIPATSITENEYARIDSLADRLKKELGVPEVVIGYVGPVIGAHSGPGTLALFYLGKER